VSPETSAPPTTPVATAPENQTAKPNSTKPAEKPVEKKQASDQEASAAVQPVVHDDQIAVRMPGKAAKGATQDDEEAVAPPTGVVGPGEAPNLGHVVAAVPAAMPAALPPQRLAVSQGVSQGLLIHQVSPAYPALARESHITGAVQLRALIGKDGSVRTLKLIGGHPLLAKAAMDAVRQWRYKPYLLNGQPVEVDTQITVQFKM
jgi:protein TonB